ncbi:PAS domain S-box protein [Haloplanus litoreus]|uniref:histidine kinase n=1 Tax=Haloplanus litoreus TaxID=767515 RepID=A0ABD5ZZP0_9EURY
MADSVGDGICVLYADDDADAAESTAAVLEREAGFTVETVGDARTGLARLDARDIDCVVSDYELSDRTGTEFLRAVRDRSPDLPFVLYTGAGSEAVASEAISAGVTDYLRRDGHADEHAILANRIHNAVERYRRERERRHHLDAIETAQEGIAILNDGEFVYANEAYAALYGYDPEDLVGEGWERLYPDDEMDRIREEVLPRVEAEGRWHGETTGLRADGSTFAEDHRLATTDRGGLVCSVRDVSNRLKLDRQFEAVFEDPQMLVGVLSPDGRLRKANRTAMEFVDADHEDLVGRPFSETPWWPEERRSEVEAWIERAADGEYVEYDATHVRSETGRRSVNGTIRPVTDASGTIVSLIVSARDITERRDHERELQRRNDRLNEFTSVVSHDLRNPLNVATGHLSVARRDAECDHLDETAHALDRMGDLIEDLLTLARAGERVSDFETVDLAETVRECWRNVSTTGTAIDVETARSIRADRSQLQHLLENLFRNSVEHGSTGSRNTADDSVEHGSTGSRNTADDSVEHGSTGSRNTADDSVEHGSTGSRNTADDSVEHGSTGSRNTADDSVEHGSTEAGTAANGVSITVGECEGGFYIADDGPGIPEADRDAVFESGFSTSNEGTGFGLSIVAEIADAHDWVITITESAAGGTRFEITGVVSPADPPPAD